MPLQWALEETQAKSDQKSQPLQRQELRQQLAQALPELAAASEPLAAPTPLEEEKTRTAGQMMEAEAPLAQTWQQWAAAAAEAARQRVAAGGQRAAAAAAAELQSAQVSRH